MSNEIIIGYPFVKHVDQLARPTIENPKEYLEKCFQRHHPNLSNLMYNGNVKCMGYRYDFSKYLRKFLYKQYGDWREVYAPNKTILRKCVYGKVNKIIELID